MYSYYLWFHSIEAANIRQHNNQISRLFLLLLLLKWKEKGNCENWQPHDVYLFYCYKYFKGTFATYVIFIINSIIQCVSEFDSE